MRISDWSSDVCSSDLIIPDRHGTGAIGDDLHPVVIAIVVVGDQSLRHGAHLGDARRARRALRRHGNHQVHFLAADEIGILLAIDEVVAEWHADTDLDLCFWRSEEHTSELQSLMRISYAVFC